tara:strand:- start:152 stop:898 length:747 start_codon:yes stop_codon:yes gene_type:complete
MSNIAILIPSTTKGRNWSNIKESYLYNLTIKTFLLKKCKNYNYTFYIGYDDDDIILSDKYQQEFIKKFTIAFIDVKFIFISMKNIKKGHLTVMWNKLFKIAYDDNNDYFFQCGDDINFHTNNWITDSINILQSNNNIGISGPINNNFRILTQVMVSRKHMEIFGWFFPEEIINWCCDDWYNIVYKPNHFYPLHNHFCSNEGGKPRYVINNDDNFTDITKFQTNVDDLRKKTFILAEEHKKLISQHILK